MLISKSMYIRGLQCEKSLFMNKYNPELKVFSNETQAKFEVGNRVGKLAQELFPGGVDCGMETTGRNVTKSLELTSEAIKGGKKIIYEAAFQYNGMLAIIDIMVKAGNSWNLYEVKSSTEIKDYQLNDVALQYYAIKGSGIKVNDLSIAYINNKYVKIGKLSINKLFTVESVIEKAIGKQDEIEPNKEKYQKVLNSRIIPIIEISPKCFDPFDCDFHEHCWKHIPKYSVFNLSNIRSKSYELYNKGIIKIKDIPKDFKLSENQTIEKESYIKNKDHINKENISVFLKQLKYPLYFMDFETIRFEIPVWDNTHPYLQIPFQYSLHIVKKKNSEPEHLEFLADGKGDPRISFIERLLNDTKGKGTILVYNNSFETPRLKEIAKYFPKYQKEIDERISRIVDLIVPFRSKDYYKPAMQGSYSIKKVLPAISPELSYDNLEISEGGSANLEFLRMMSLTDEIEIQKIRRNLLEYCKMDTQAMIILYNSLSKLS